MSGTVFERSLIKTAYTSGKTLGFLINFFTNPDIYKGIPPKNYHPHPWRT